MNARSITRDASEACAGAVTVVGTVPALGKDEIPEGLGRRPSGLRSAEREEG